MEAISLRQLKTLHGILERRLLQASGGAAFRQIVNRKLSELAREEYDIPLEGDLNFVGLAEAGARTAGLPNPDEDAYVLLDQIITRSKSTTDLTGLNRDYARATVLASVVHHLREQGENLKKVMEHPMVKEIMDRYKIRPSTVENYFNGKLPNKRINVERLWTPMGRDNALASYDASKGDLPAYLKTVLRNQALDLKRALDQESDVLHHAVRIKTDSDDERTGLDPECSSELSIDPRDEIDSHFMVDQFRRKLTAKNPQYLELLSLLKDDELDISRDRDHAAIQRRLGIKSRPELIKLRDAFLRDLRLIFKSLDADAPLAETLLRSAALPSTSAKAILRQIESLVGAIAH